jgi:hypothetical protein
MAADPVALFNYIIPHISFHYRKPNNIKWTLDIAETVAI